MQCFDLATPCLQTSLDRRLPLCTCHLLATVAPAGSGLEGDICSRCYASFRNKGTLPTKPNSRLRGVLARLQQQQAAQGSKQGSKQGGS